MDNFDKASKIKRTVENVAYNIMERYDPDYTITLDELFEAVVWDIDWMEWEVGDKTDQMIKFHCQQFIENELGGLQQEFKQGAIDRQERKRYKQSHIPTKI